MRPQRVNLQKESRKDNKRVLVIEDEAAARDATQRYLQFCGYEVKTASAASEALQVSSEFKPQILVCDCKLGDRNDGIEVARQIQGELGSIVIFVTAWSLKDVREHFHGMDVRECLRKPVSLSALAAVIDACPAQ